MSSNKLLFAASFLLAQTAFSAEFACPAFQEKHPLATASVFDGPPEERADLMPDSSTGKDSHAVSTWDVGYLFDAGRKVFLVCKYSGADKTVTVKAETKVEHCTYHAPAKARPASLVCK